MRWITGVGLMLVIGLLGSCANKTETAEGHPHGTVLMRDGTSISGTIVESTAKEIKVSGDDGATHIIPLEQVRSLEYDQAPVAAPAETAASTQPAPAPNAPPPAETHENHYHPVPAAIETKTYTLGAGAQIPVRAEETIDSGVAVEGQSYAAEITADVRDADGAVVIPRGSNAKIVILSASKGGRFRGQADLVLNLQSVSVGGRRYELDTSDVTKKGRDGVGVNKRTAVFTGTGAAIGAVIGAIAGGGKGAAIGAASGAGAGAVTQIVTKGGSIKVPAETILTFKLDQALKVNAR